MTRCTLSCRLSAASRNATFGFNYTALLLSLFMIPAAYSLGSPSAPILQVALERGPPLNAVLYGSALCTSCLSTMLFDATQLLHGKFTQKRVALEVTLIIIIAVFGNLSSALDTHTPDEMALLLRFTKAVLGGQQG